MEIGGIPLVNLAPSSVLLVVFLLNITDKLVWHKRIDEATADLTRQLKVKDDLIDELTKQNTQLVDSLGTVNAFLTALHNAADVQSRSDDAEA